MPEDNELWEETALALFMLCIHLGIIASVITTYPEHVQEGFQEKLQQIRDFAQKESEEIQLFGEAYDDEA